MRIPVGAVHGHDNRIGLASQGALVYLAVLRSDHPHIRSNFLPGLEGDDVT